MIEEPIELPPGWTLAPLGDVACLRKEPVNPKEKPGNRFNYLSIGNVESNTGNLVDFKPTLGKDINSLKLTFTRDDVLYSKLRPYLNKVLMPEFDGISATDLIPITPNKSIEKKYLGYYLRTRCVVEYANQRLRGIQLPRLTTKDLLALTVPVAPLAEQRRIVAKVEALFSESKTVREALDKVAVLLRRFSQSVLAKAFGGELNQRAPNDETGQKFMERMGQERQRIWNLEKRGRYKQPLTPDVASLPKLPSNWCWATIDQLSIVVRGASPRPAGDSRFFGGKIPWITVGSLTADEQPHLETVRETVTEAGRDASRYIEPHTLLLTNSGATLGVPKITLIGGCINDGIVGLLHVDYPLKSYLYYFLKSQTKRLRDINQGAAQPNLNTDIIRAIKVPIPPLKEQEEIVARIEGLFSLSDRIEIDVKKTKEKTDSIDRVILARAFRGELVPQDSNDELASVLLKRIEGDLAKSRVETAREKAKPDYQRKPQKEEKQIKSLQEVLREIGPATIEQTFEASGLSMNEFWDKLKIETKAGRIEKSRKGNLILLRVKN